MEEERDPDDVACERDEPSMTISNSNTGGVEPDVGIDVDRAMGHEILLDDAAWFD